MPSEEGYRISITTEVTEIRYLDRDGGPDAQLCIKYLT